MPLSRDASSRPRSPRDGRMGHPRHRADGKRGPWLCRIAVATWRAGPCRSLLRQGQQRRRWLRHRAPPRQRGDLRGGPPVRRSRRTDRRRSGESSHPDAWWAAAHRPIRTAASTKHNAQRAFADADWIVDALFGSGLTGPLRPPFDRIVRAINESPARVFAVDIPSGLDCDTGLPLGATVRAHHTGTIAALKKGFVRPAATPGWGKSTSSTWACRVAC